MEAFRTALITGASSGIGEAFAQRLAEDGCDLVLVARSQDKLKALARKIAKEHGRRVEVLAADLAQPAPGAPLAEAVKALGLDVDLLVNNAGFGTVGAFHSLDPARERQEIFLNAAAVVDLTHAFLPAMVERGRGGVINVASAAAFQAIPYMAVYAATKAFVLSFSEALWGEYHARGIRVVCACPGPVDTRFFEATGNPNLRSTVPRRLMLNAEEVVAQSLTALERGRLLVIPGVANKAVALTSKFLPRKLITAAAARAMKRR